MSSLRFCGILAKQALSKQQRFGFNAPLLVPVALRLTKDLNSSLQLQQHRGYKKFGHEPTPVPNITRIWHLVMGIMFLTCTLNWKA